MPVRQPAGERATRVARSAAAVLAAVAALMLIAVAARSGRTETLSPVTRPATSAAPTSTPSVGPQPTARPEPAQPGQTSGVLSTIVITLIGLAVLFALASALRRRGRRRRRGPLWPERHPDQASGAPPGLLLDPAVARALTGAVDAALRQLDGGRARDAVIACWVLLEQSAAEAGTLRRPAETAAELTARVLHQHQVTEAPLRRLADLYREARFSRHPLGEDAREQARATLVQVRRELAEPTTDAAPTGPGGGAVAG